MDKTIHLQKNLIRFGIPVLIMGMLVILSKTLLFIKHTDYLSIGITIDLLLIVPLVYFLLIRKSSIPNTTVIPFIILGVVICSFINPAENQQYLSLFKTWMLPVIELCVLGFVFFKLKKAIKEYKL